MCGTGSELGLSTVEIFQGSRWREKEAWGRGEQWANPGSEYSEDQRSRLGEEGSEATKRVTKPNWTTEREHRHEKLHEGEAGLRSILPCTL